MKVSVGFWISKGLKEKFEKKCRENAIDKRALIENFMKEYVGE